MLGDLLGQGYTLLHISKDLGLSQARGQEDLNGLFAEAAAQGWRTAALTPSTAEDARAYQAEHGANYAFYSTDPTELKIIVRSNPGMVLLKDGVVVEKWAWRDFPTSFTDLQGAY